MTVPDDRRIRDFVYELLRWDLAAVSVDWVARGDHSGLVPILASLELGVVGTGCEGTKGVGRPPEVERVPRRADPEATARYHALRGEDLRTADAVLADSRGDQLVMVAFGRRTIECTLAQRVGFRLMELENVERYRRWVDKIVIRDGRGPLTSAGEIGGERLRSAARAWFAGNSL